MSRLLRHHRVQRNAFRSAARSWHLVEAWAFLSNDVLSTILAARSFLGLCSLKEQVIGVVICLPGRLNGLGHSVYMCSPEHYSDSEDSYDHISDHRQMFPKDPFVKALLSASQGFVGMNIHVTVGTCTAL